jgi:GT2 family glycosyltransferase
MTAPKVAVVVLNWNGWCDTQVCLRSLRELDYSNVSTYLVDNGSTDGSVERCKAEFPWAAVIQNEENLGFAGGNNIGIRRALSDGADYVLLLNNDTVVEPTLLSHLVSAGEQSVRVGIVGPKIYYDSERRRIWFAGGRITPPGRIGHYGWNQIDQGQCDEPREVDFITGCAMLIKRAVFERIGCLASEFFLLFEETDFCVRARRHDFICWYEPRATLYHKVSASFGGFSPDYYYYLSRNYLLFQERNMIPVYGWRAKAYAARYLVGLLGYFFLTPWRGGWRRCSAIIEGVTDYSRGRLYQRRIHRVAEISPGGRTAC